MFMLTPISSTIILSNPTGPKELFTTFEIAQAAITENHFQNENSSAENDQLNLNKQIKT